MLKRFWHRFILRLERSVTVNMIIVKYVSYNLDVMISPDGAYIRFQYFLIYFNQVIHNTIKTFNAVS